MLVVSAGFATVRVDLHRFCDIFLLIWAYFTWLQRFGKLGWVRIDLGIFGELGLLNLIGSFDFYGFELFGWIWVDFNRFAWICADLGWLERIAVDLEDRYKFIFVGFGRVRWIRVEMATYLDGSGKILMALSGFDWIWLDLGADSYGFLSRILSVIEGFSWIVEGFGWT